MTDVIGIFNADGRKSVTKFSGLGWFLVFEDLYNGEGSLQAKKTSKKRFNLNLNLKVGPSPSKKKIICLIESPLKWWKKIYFVLKAFFRPQDI